MQMPDDMLSAIKAQIIDPQRGWKVTAVSSHSHKEIDVADVGGVPTPIARQVKQAIITLQSRVMGGAMVLTAEGDEGGAFTSGSANILGTTYSFDDAGLLNWCAESAEAFGAVAAATFMQGLFGPMPEG